MASKVKVNKNTLKKYGFIFTFLMVQIFCFFVFYIGVNFSSILMAFDVPKGEKLFYNFEYFLQTTSKSLPVFSEYLPNTLKFFFVDWILLLFGFTFSYFIYKRIWGYRFFRVIFFLPSIICSTVLVMIYKNVVGVDGPLVEIYMKLTNTDIAPEFLANSDTAMTTVLLYGLWTSFGSKILLLGGAMVRIPVDVIEYGKLEGVKPMREMFTIVMPMIWPTVSTMMLMMMTGVFTASGPILLFTEGYYGTTTISYYIFMMVYGANEGMYPIASAIGLFFTAIGLPIVLIVKYILDKIDTGVSY